jgi:hypothetical protein
LRNAGTRVTLCSAPARLTVLILVLLEIHS